MFAYVVYNRSERSDLFGINMLAGLVPWVEIDKMGATVDQYLLLLLSPFIHCQQGLSIWSVVYSGIQLVGGSNKSMIGSSSK